MRNNPTITVLMVEPHRHPYMMIAIEQRESEDYRSYGELFMFFYQEVQDITFTRSLALIVELFKVGMKELLGVSEQQIQAVVDYVVAALPAYLKRALSAANERALHGAA